MAHTKHGVSPKIPRKSPQKTAKRLAVKAARKVALGTKGLKQRAKRTK